MFFLWFMTQYLKVGEVQDLPGLGLILLKRIPKLHIRIHFTVGQSFEESHEGILLLLRQVEAQRL